MINAKSVFYRNLVEKHSHDSKKLWSVINKDLLYRTHSPMPSDISPQIFADFFKQKVENITKEFVDTKAEPPLDITFCKASSTFTLTQFQPISYGEIEKLLSITVAKSCSLDPIKTGILKKCKETIISPLTHVINGSIKDGLPMALKHALITPVLKSQKMDASNVASYRPISNLPFVAKLTEKVIVQQLTCYLERIHAFDIAQSAYRQFHSTETLLLKLKNDILLAIDDRKVTALVQLDLSAAFDTIDHTTLLTLV
jgi:hypothetical protein